MQYANVPSFGSSLPAYAERQPPAILYIVDANNLILEAHYYDERYLPGPNDVIGTSLLSHVAGISSAAFVVAALDKARRGEVAKIPYRCDTEERVRRWLMIVSGLPQGRVSIEHFLLAERKLERKITLQTAVTSFVGAIPHCCICGGLFTRDKWVDPDEFDLLHFSEGAGVINVIHEVCEPCDRLAR